VPVFDTVRAPWSYALSTAQHDLIHYAIVVAGLALFAMFVRDWVSVDEIGARYRPATYASLCITGVAFLSYVYIAVKLDTSYVLRAGEYVPTADARTTYVPRYMDWSVTVPLLMVELLAVSGLRGAAQRSMRLVTMSCAFAMIATGFLGAAVISGGDSTGAMLLWGLISTAFYIALYVLIGRVLTQSRGSMGAEAYASYRNATLLLMSSWGWYPIAFAIHNWFPGSGWTTTIQVGYSIADVVAKVGFGSLIHKVAKLRTAEDVVKGEESHPEDVWISSVKHSSGVLPRLLESSAVDHRDRVT
jgi:bacteriorhodopsin